jgi:hypothetical protein
MGGMSYKCPKCEKWFFTKWQLHGHLVRKHQEPRGFHIEGTGPITRIVRDETPDVHEFR